jgi:uncharacterized membrane protein YqiK
MDISVKKLEIARKGKDGLVCKDNIRADITVAFYIRVEATEESVRKVAQMLTPERVSDMVQLRELFEAKFSEALKTVGKQMEFHELFTERITFRDQIQNTIGKDLDGFFLQDVAIDYLEQTPLEQHDPGQRPRCRGHQENHRDHPARAGRRQRVFPARQRAVEKENADADIAKREQKRRNEEDTAKQHRAITEIQANEEAEARKVIEARRMEVEAKRLEADESIKLRTEDMNRAVQEREFTVRKEQKRLEQEALQEGEEARVRRERTVDARRHGQAGQGRRGRRRGRTQPRHCRRRAKGRRPAAGGKDQHRSPHDRRARARGHAHRGRDERQEGTGREGRGLRGAKGGRPQPGRGREDQDVTAAEAGREAALREAERIQTMADAEAKASEKRRHAMEQEAEGLAAQEAASGLAEAKVITAKAGAKKAEAEATKVLGLAEADVIKAKGDVTAEVTQTQAEAEAEGTKEKELAAPPASRPGAWPRPRPSRKRPRP